MAAKHRTRQHEALQRALLTLRQRRRLKQDELAELLGKPQSYISKYESGERKLDLPELDNICRAMNVSLETLIRQYRAGLRS
jgi:transcriptional regulator with XRE-family HTH domain